jgi:hypothetical protein
MLKYNYGEMIIRKDSLLYHTSDDLFQYTTNNIKPMLFCTFHPSDFTGDNKYVYYVKIKKDISLLFMIEHISNIKIYSSLNQIINHPSKNLAKQNNSFLKIIIKDLKNENFDGWFSSIENKSAVEIALINDFDIYEIIDSKELKRNWNNGHYTGNNNENIIIKNWGKYKICTIEKPVILNINNKFKQLLKKYKEYEIKSKFPYEYTFQIILNNAIINYFN